MKIGITSQNFRTITGHAGKSRRFLVYSVSKAGEIKEEERLDLPKEMSMHEFRGNHHPLFELDVLITAGCGHGFARRMASNGVEVITTGEEAPLAAVEKFIKGEALVPAVPHSHEHEGANEGHHRGQAPGLQVKTSKSVELDFD